VQSSLKHVTTVRLGWRVTSPADVMQSFEEQLDAQYGGVVLRIWIIVEAVQIVARRVCAVVAEGDAVGVEARDNLGGSQDARE
jgi:adenylyl- and sulfurtransferase ThiI